MPTALLVPFTSVSVRDESVYSRYQDASWAEPDEGAAAAALMRLRDDNALYQSLSAQAFCSIQRLADEWRVPELGALNVYQSGSSRVDFPLLRYFCLKIRPMLMMCLWLVGSLAVASASIGIVQSAVLRATIDRAGHLTDALQLTLLVSEKPRFGARGRYQRLRNGGNAGRSGIGAREICDRCE